MGSDQPQDVKTHCEVDGGRVIFCTSLSKSLEGTNAERKGVTSLYVTKLKTLESRVRGAILKSGDYGKRGVMMNFCPFCGTKIIKALEFNEDEKNQEGEAASASKGD